MVAKLNTKNKNYKRLESGLKHIVPKIQDVFNLTKEQAIEWLKLNNIAFDGKKPLDLYLEKREDLVIEYIDIQRLRKEFK